MRGSVGSISAAVRERCIICSWRSSDIAGNADIARKADWGGKPGTAERPGRPGAVDRRAQPLGAVLHLISQT